MHCPSASTSFWPIFIYLINQTKDPQVSDTSQRLLTLGLIVIQCSVVAEMGDQKIKKTPFPQFLAHAYCGHMVGDHVATIGMGQKLGGVPL